MSELIQSKEDLVYYLTAKKIASKNPPERVNVTSALRKIVMTDERQGSFIHNGTCKSFEFKSLGGGVYSASIKQPNNNGD